MIIILNGQIELIHLFSWFTILDYYFFHRCIYHQLLSSNFIRSIRIKRNQNYISLRKDWRNDFNCRKNRVKICNKSILKIHTCKSVIANCSDKPSQLQIALDPSNKVIPLGFVPIAAPFDSILTWLNPFLFFLSLNNAASSHRIRFFIFYFFSPPSLSLSFSPSSFLLSVSRNNSNSQFPGRPRFNRVSHHRPQRLAVYSRG